MRQHIDDMFPTELANMIKIDSNEMETRVGVDLVKLVELGIVQVVGVMDGKVLYQSVGVGE